MRWTKASTWKIARSWETLGIAPFLDEIKKRSMLHQETLGLLHHFSSRADGAILEIGSFIGGATTVLAHGLVAGNIGGTVVTVERGGSSTHSALPTADKIGDTRKTLQQFGVLDRVTIVEGMSGDESTTRRITEALNGRRIALLVIDADGQLDRDWRLYRGMMSDDAIICCDDYAAVSDQPPQKQAEVERWVDAAITDGLVTDLGLYPWATWFGQVRKTGA
jgi:predicted O-methyltransferase YrrM